MFSSLPTLRSSITVTFDLERDVDIASVETQNRVAQVQPRLPSEVNDIGVTVAKSSPDTLMFLSFYSPKGSYDQLFLNNYLFNYILDTLKRVKGVGEAKVYGSEFGMRLWLRPDKMASLGLTATDVVDAIQEQNKQAAAGQVGQPPADSPSGFQYSLRLQGRLVEQSEFEDIILRSLPDGSYIRVRDVARVELGAKDYSTVAKFNGQPAAAMSIALAPGANALETAELINAEMERLAQSFPGGPGLRHHLRHLAVRGGVDRGGRAHLRRGADPGADRGVPVPAELARDAHPDAGGAGVADRHVHRLPVPRLLDQHAVAVRHGAGDRHRRR